MIGGTNAETPMTTSGEMITISVTDISGNITVVQNGKIVTVNFYGQLGIASTGGKIITQNLPKPRMSSSTTLFTGTNPSAYTWIDDTGLYIDALFAGAYPYGSLTYIAE